MHLLKRERKVFVDPNVPDSKDVYILTASFPRLNPHPRLLLGLHRSASLLFSCLALVRQLG